MCFRTATARGKAELADMAADHAREDSDIARATAKQFAPDFQQPSLDRFRNRENYRNRQQQQAAEVKINDQSALQQQQHLLQHLKQKDEIYKKEIKKI